MNRQNNNKGQLLRYVPLAEIKRIQKEISDELLLSEILADVFRINTLYMITRAGSGHIGTSFSSIDIVTWLWTREMVNPNEPDDRNSDIYFSSKGHDVPALYALLIGLGKLEFDYIHKLRRLGGLPGHPDIRTTPEYLVANTGSLGMGISKARGMAKAKRLDGSKGHFYVLTGDGELQEGQIWESLQPTANQKFSEITVIVDHNKIQSDSMVHEVSDLGDLEKKFEAFGWEVARCDGHDMKAISDVLTKFKSITDRPQILIADTVKGKGVSFIEKLDADGFYKFHAGAPNEEQYEEALNEMIERVNTKLAEKELSTLALESYEVPLKSPSNGVRLTTSYGEALTEIARENENVVVLDADLVKSCGLIPFSKEFPERFIECGIAEQDMVSMAGGLALSGKIPIVHSLACFLSTRPNEQIYNNATEETKIIYVGTQAGLLPGGPGHSHQSVRDISCLGSVPGLTLIEPSSPEEIEMALKWAVSENPRSTYLRIVSTSYPIEFELPKDYTLKFGCGALLRKGTDAVIISYGPVMLTEAMRAAEILESKGVSLAVYNVPWLNCLDDKWLKKELSQFQTIFTVDDHYTLFGQGMFIGARISQTRDKSTSLPSITSFGLDDIPESGSNQEILKHHRLDANSLTERIQKQLSSNQ